MADRFRSLALVAAALGLALSLCSRALRAADAIYLGTTTGPYKSTDNGATFVPLAAKIGINPHPFLRGVPDIVSIAVDPRDSQVVYMVARFNRALAIGLLKTTDGGQTWTAVPLSDVKNGGALLVDPVAENVLYIHDLGVNSAFRSMDGGASWQPLTPPRTAAGKFRHLNTDSRVGRVLYMNGDDEQFFKSSDYGSTWTLLARIPGVSGSEMFVDPRNTRHLILTGAGRCSDGTAAGCGPLRSTDGGITWTNQQLRISSGGYNVKGKVVYDPRTDKLYMSAHLAGLGGAMLGSPDGEGWMPLSNDPQFEGLDGGLGAAPLAADGKEGLALYTFSNNSTDRPRSKVIKSTDGGVTWVAQPGPVAVCPENPQEACPNMDARINAIATPVAAPDEVQNVSTASYVGGAFSPESIVSIFGVDLAPAIEGGDGKITSLLGTSVTIIDSAGVSRQAPLFFVSPGQINYLLPSGAATGAATIRVDRGAGAPLEQTVQITDIAPGIFTLNSAGLAAAGLLRVSGVAQTPEGVYAVDAAGAVVALPVDLGPPGDQVYLTLYGTGLRAAATAGTTLTMNGNDVPVQYAGAQGGFVGLDQINALLPRSLAGAGKVEIVVRANGLPANTVYLQFQ